MEEKRIGYVTRGFLGLPIYEQFMAINEFIDQAMERDDWHYTLRGGRVFAELNEEGSYTLMLAEEH